MSAATLDEGDSFADYVYKIILIVIITNLTKNKMAKFLKSFFAPEKRKSNVLEGDVETERDDFTPPLDGRRKLSISRSGRMKQANKKRHELNLDLYGEDQQHEKPKNMEYHVNKNAETDLNRRSSLDSHTARTEQKDQEERRVSVNRRNSSEEIKTPEEEIESAFEIIDKIS